MNAPAPVRNDIVFVDDATTIEMVQPIINRLAKERIVYHPGTYTTGVWTIVEDVWKLNPQGLLDVVADFDVSSENPIIYGAVPGDLRGNQVSVSPSDPYYDTWIAFRQDFLDSTPATLARDAAEDMIREDYVQDEFGVDCDADGKYRYGWVNCPLIVVDSNTVGYNGFHLLVDAIRKRQQEVREQGGVDIATLQVFVHNGSADTLRPLEEFLVSTSKR